MRRNLRGIYKNLEGASKTLAWVALVAFVLSVIQSPPNSILTGIFSMGCLIAALLNEIWHSIEKLNQRLGVLPDEDVSETPAEGTDDAVEALELEVDE